jgi:hypothetical protein
MVRLTEQESPYVEIQASWFDPFLSVLADIPRKELHERLRVDPSTIRRRISGTCPPSGDLRYPVERICCEYVVRRLEPLGSRVSDHPAKAAAIYSAT